MTLEYLCQFLLVDLVPNFVFKFTDECYVGTSDYKFTGECYVWTSDYSPESFNICIDIVSFKKIKSRAFYFCDKDKHSVSLKWFRAHLKKYAFKQVLMPLELAWLKK